MALDQDLIAAALPLYEVQSELGRGAWGVVLAGRHRELGRDVAIKQLPRAFGADPAVRARFVAEARLLASLNHTHIVGIYDFVEHGGLCLLVIERLTGGTVTSRFKSGALTAQRSCAVGLASCAALDYAHQHGVLHRDVKPDNLMFSSEAVLKITDFGIAKVIGGSDTVATRAGDVLGTPAYMAPEQAQGGTLGPATDIYSLGAVLYELFSGRLPFAEDQNPLATLYRHVYEKPHPLRPVAPHIPARLAEVIDRALATEAADRYPTAEAFGIALAEAAAEGWGPGWLAETGIMVAATGPMSGAWTGRTSKLETIATPGTAGMPGSSNSGVEAPVGTDDSQPTPADLVPVNLLRPELFQAAPVVEPVADQTSPPPGTLDGQPPSPPAPSLPVPPPSPPARKPRRRRRFVIAGAAIGVVVALVAITLVLTSGSTHHHPPPPTAPPRRVTATAWRSVHDMPTARQQVGASVVDGVAWVVGGLTSVTSTPPSTPKVEGYDPGIDTWESGPDLPLPLHHVMVVTYHNELVALGGWVASGGNLTATVSDKVFALRNDSWVELPHMIDPRAAGAAAVVGNQIVVFGGQANGHLVPAVDVFDGTHWFQSAPLPTPRDHLAGASDGHFVYAVGGRLLSDDKNLGTFERYDPATGRWTRLPDLPTPRGGLGAAIVGNRLVTAGGELPTTAMTTVEIFDLLASSWSSGPSLPTPRHGLTLVTMGSTVYAFGGALQPGHTGSSTLAEALDFT